MALITRRSSTRALPRVSVGRCGLIFENCAFVSQNWSRLIYASFSEAVNHATTLVPTLLWVQTLGRTCRGRARLTNSDRLVFVQLYRWFPSIIGVLRIIRPETLIRWHRARFRSYWRWRSRNRGGRPQIDAELRALIAQISADNPLWGAPRIHGELLKLG